jgi:hypothetical protein
MMVLGVVLTFPVTMGLLLVGAVPALAQPASQSPTVLLTVTATTVVIAVLSVLVGFVSQAISTGTFLGVIPLPPAWVPYVTLFGTFLTAFVASIATTSATGSVVWVNALLAGFMALTGAVGGITAHQHISAPKLTRQAAYDDKPSDPSPINVAPPS